jgi:hypothetical protein
MTIIAGIFPQGSDRQYRNRGMRVRIDEWSGGTVFTRSTLSEPFEPCLFINTMRLSKGNNASRFLILQANDSFYAVVTGKIGIQTEAFRH